MRRGPRRDRRPPATALDDEPVERTDERLLEVLEDGFETAARRAGSWLVCRSGCSECCHGPFPVTRLDALRLRRGLESLRGARPGRAAAVERRARDAVVALAPGFPGEHASGRLHVDEQALDRFFERHASMPCPALDPDSGRCELYAARPVACRTYGPPLRFGEEQAPPCRLCFQGADTATVDRCRYEPDPAFLEERLLSRLGVRAGEEWETLIAFVLAGYL
jgi:Fe-S-cluster containining protein